MSSLPASASMKRNIITVAPDEKLVNAQQLMKKNNFRHLPVVLDGKLLGMLSDRDILVFCHINDQGTIDLKEDLRVESAYSRHPIACSINSKISDIAKLMIREKVDALPVLNERGKLAGMLTSTDLLEILTSEAGTILDKELPINFHLSEFEKSELEEILP